MATTQQILNQEFELLVNDLKEKHISLGMKSSGKWLNELEVVSGVDTVKIVGEHYTYQLVNGRKNGKFPPIASIKQWILDKGITSDLPISSLAFLIARKIAKEGTKYYKQGGTDLIDGVVTPKRMQSIIDKVGAELTVSLVTKLENNLKTVMQ